VNRAGSRSQGRLAKQAGSEFRDRSFLGTGQGGQVSVDDDAVETVIYEQE
jgi:hypothetical protein